MPPAIVPVDEYRRLEALHRLAILDSGPETYFEDVVDALSEVVKAPMLLVSFVDETRQWFKARRGLELSETPRDIAFCAHTILNNGPLVVPDSAQDARFSDNPLVFQDPHMRAYVGSPIVLQCGARVGAMCAIDHEPRRWTVSEIAHVERCSRLVSLQLDARRSHLERDRHTFLERALVRTEKRYQSLLDLMSEGMVVHGPSGAILDFNAAACEILGLSGEQLLGKTSTDPSWRTITPDGDPFPGEQHPAMVSLRSGTPQYGVAMGVQASDGTRRWLRVSSYPVVDEASGRVQQVVVVFKRDPGLGGALASRCR